MSDARLRELERRWREGRDPQDARRWVHELARAGASPAEVLLARQEAGLLAPERLAAAAALGDPAARQALEAGPPGPPDLLAALTPVIRLGQEACVRAALAAARAVLPAFEERLASEPRPRRALAAAEAWLLCPCEPHAAEAARAAEAAWLLCDQGGRQQDPILAVTWAQSFPDPALSLSAAAVASAAGAAAFACRAREPIVAEWAVQAAESAAESLGAARLGPRAAAAAAAGGGRTAGMALAALRGQGAEAILEAVREELVPWLLGPGEARSLG